MIPFSSERKRMTVAYGLPANWNSNARSAEDILRAQQNQFNTEFVRVVVKGAPEYVIPLCTSELDQAAEAAEFDGEGSNGAEHLEQVVSNAIARNSMKPLTIAYRDFAKEEFDELMATNENFETEESRKVIESQLTLVATVGLEDPLREGVQEAYMKLF